jgi:serine/threonine protein kinase
MDDGNHPNDDETSEIEPEEKTVLTQSPVLRAEEFPPGLTPRELAHALQGELLDHFQLLQFIGAGGMGIVFKALDTTLDRIVALKILASQSIGNVDLQRRFLIEAQSTARLDHPNIAQIHFVGRDRGLPYIVFEYIEGENLRDRVMRDGPLPLSDALSYTHQVAHALAHAWQRNVVHRDIKPSNILVTDQGQAKLVDMGLARLHQAESIDDDLTNTGVTLGTFDYISPEQARDPRSADTRSDIYSLGCSLFYLLAGKPPFARGTAVQKLLQHQGEQPPALSDIRIDLPKSVDVLVERMLAKSVEDRPQSPTELVQELGQIMQEIGMPLPQILAPLPSVGRPRRMASWRHIVPWAVPAALLIAIVTWFDSSESSSSGEYSFPELRTADSASASADHASNISPDGTSPKAIVETSEHADTKPSGTPIDIGLLLHDLGEQSDTEEASSHFMLEAVDDPDQLSVPSTDELLMPPPDGTNFP